MNIYPYHPYSETARELSRALGARRIRHEGSIFRGRPSKVVLNWGASELPPQVLRCQVLNNPESVALAVNKRKFFETMDPTGLVPPWTTSRETAQEWLHDGRKVVCRTVLTGNSGRGVVIARTPEQMVAAPLYTRYIPKETEWRVHVFNAQVLDIQRKGLSSRVDPEDANWEIRNWDNGFVFIRGDVNNWPEEFLNRLREAALKTTATLRLHFGAMDIIHNASTDRIYVLEANTAPHFEGITLDKYVEALRNV